MGKHMCWVGTYVSRAALTPHSWCDTVSSRPYQIREEPKERVSFCVLSWIFPQYHQILIRDGCTHGGLPLASLCAICVQWLNGGQGDSGSSHCTWVLGHLIHLHGNTQTTMQEKNLKGSNDFFCSQEDQKIKKHWNVTWHLLDLSCDGWTDADAWLDAFTLSPLWCDGNLCLFFFSHGTNEGLYLFLSYNQTYHYAVLECN